MPSCPCIGLGVLLTVAMLAAAIYSLKNDYEDDHGIQS